ncbi:MAG: hypothetical protein IKU36_02000 [Bacteroidales bacterium]|nr:hypothetical protein [Bacteroidales bacterium]
MPYIDIQRQNYIEAIRNSISETVMGIKEKEKDILQIQNLMEYCKANKLRKFRRKVVKQELRIALQEKKELEKRRKEFTKLLGLAEQYAPGKGWRG